MEFQANPGAGLGGVRRAAASHNGDDVIGRVLGVEANVPLIALSIGVELKKVIHAGEAPGFSKHIQESQRRLHSNPQRFARQSGATCHHAAQSSKPTGPVSQQFTAGKLTHDLAAEEVAKLGFATLLGQKTRQRFHGGTLIFTEAIPQAACGRLHSRRGHHLVASRAADVVGKFQVTVVARRSALVDQLAKAPLMTRPPAAGCPPERRHAPTIKIQPANRALPPQSFGDLLSFEGLSTKRACGTCTLLLMPRRQRNPPGALEVQAVAARQLTIVNPKGAQTP